jgi:uncharacterized delta-60 repeat protein
MRVRVLLTGLLLVAACGGGSSKKPQALPAPTGVVAAAGIAENTIGWTPLPAATGYNVYWDTSPGVTKSTGSQIPVTAPPFTHTTLTVGTTYHYVVTAVRKNKESQESAEVSATPIPPPPPGGVTATAGDTEVRIDWIAVPGATSYNLYFDTSPGVTPSTGTPIPSVTAPFDHGGLPNRITFHYVLTSLVGTHEGAPSLEVSATPLDRPRGALDTSFGGQGWITHDGAGGGGTEDAAYGVALDSAGRILATGYSLNSGSHRVMATWRLNEDGSLDTTFNAQGWVTHDGGGTIMSFDEGWAVGEDDSGRVVVAGTLGISDSDQDIAVWRYDDLGNPDPGFGAGGLASHDGAAGGTNLEDWAYSMVLRIGGAVVVAGTGDDGSGDFDMVLLGLDDTGSLDPTFGAGGVVVHDGAAGGAGWDEAFYVVEDLAGRILVTGYSTDPTGAADMVLWRYDPMGIIDLTFGMAGTGFVTHDGAAGGTDDYGEAIRIGPSEDITISGVADNPAGDYDMVLWRFDATGTLDPVFGTGGIVVHHNAAGGNDWDDGLGLVLDAAGRVLVAGFSIAPGADRDLAVWGYLPDGTLDPFFATGGIFLYDAAVTAGSATGRAVTIDGQSRLVVAGTTDTVAGPPDMAVWRLE